MNQENMETAVNVVEKAFRSARGMTGDTGAVMALTKIIVDAYYNEQFSCETDEEEWS